MHLVIDLIYINENWDGLEENWVNYFKSNLMWLNELR